MRLTVLGLAFVIGLYSTHASALCSSQPVPVGQERAASALILLGRVVKVMPESSPDDPTGVANLTYTVQVLRLHKGKPLAHFTLRIENTSGEYRMSQGEVHYLLVQRDRAHAYFVNPCGHSRLLRQ